MPPTPRGYIGFPIGDIHKIYKDIYKTNLKMCLFDYLIFPSGNSPKMIVRGSPMRDKYSQTFLKNIFYNLIYFPQILPKPSKNIPTVLPNTFQHIPKIMKERPRHDQKVTPKLLARAGNRTWYPWILSPGTNPLGYSSSRMQPLRDSYA